MMRYRAWLPPIAAVAALLSSSLLVRTAQATDYFVDNQAGDDGFDGTTQATAWRTLAKVGSVTLNPGDIVRFRAGGSWDAQPVSPQGVHLKHSGSETQPITFTTFGTGAAPTLTNSDTSTPYTRVFTIQGSFMLIDGLKFVDTHEAGIAIDQGSSDVTVANCEFATSGFGVENQGDRLTVTRSYFHDLTMVHNTQGGDDDYGAVAVNLLGGSHHEVAYNHMERCKAPSFDYGTDGGVVELYVDAGVVLQDVSIHHNLAVGNDGVLEAGGQGDGQIHDVRVFRNVLRDNRAFTVLHNSGDNFAVQIDGLVAEHNTIVELAEKNWDLVWFSGAAAEGTYTFRDNAVYLGDYDRVFNNSGAAHDHNLYWFVNGNQDIGLALDSTEKLADPLFVDISDGDYHLQASSPAIDAASASTAGLDFDDHLVPAGNAADIGAYEYGSVQPDAGEGDSGGSGPGGSGGAGAGGSAAAGGSGGSGGAVDGGKAGAAGGGGQGKAGNPADAAIGNDASDAANDAANDSGSDSGCGCRTGSQSSDVWALQAWVALVWALARDRRSARSRQRERRL